MTKNHENPGFSVGQLELVDNCVGRRTTIETKTRNRKTPKTFWHFKKSLKGIRSLSAENTLTQTHR